MLGNVLGAIVGGAVFLAVAVGIIEVTVHRLPFDPWWALPVFLGSIVATAYVLGNDGSDILVWAIALTGIMSGTLGIDRWVERRHGHKREPRG